MKNETGEKTRREIIEDFVIQSLRGKYAYAEDSDGHFSIELYDEDTTIALNTIAEILSGKFPMDALQEKLMEWYQDSIFAAEDEEIREVMGKLSDTEDLLPGGLSTDEEELLHDIMVTHISFDPPLDRYLKQKVAVTVFLDTGDANYDFVLNAAYPHYNGSSDEPINELASLVWLAEQQGYTRKQLWDTLLTQSSDSEFLASCLQEVINASCPMLATTFLVKMTVEQAIELNAILQQVEHYARENRIKPLDMPDFGRITLDKSVVAGLFDFSNGGGGIFEIKFEKDVVIPIALIYSAMPDGGCGQSWMRTYGSNDELFCEAVKSITILKAGEKE